jgi:uncharacterized protein
MTVRYAGIFTACLLVSVSGVVHADDDFKPDVDKALEAFTSDQHELAYRHVKPLAEDGDWMGLHLLAMMHVFGHGVDQDKDYAVELFERSVEAMREPAAAGDAGAQYHLGVAYHFGNHGVEKDPELAQYWFDKAAAAGYELMEEQ